MSPRSNDAGSVARLQNGTQPRGHRADSAPSLLDIESYEAVTGARRAEARVLHRVEVDRVGAPAVMVAPVREARARPAVVVEGLAEANRRPTPAAAFSDPITEEDAVAFEVDGNPLEHPTAATAHEWERGCGAEVVQSVFLHRHRAETVANAGLNPWDGRRARLRPGRSGRVGQGGLVKNGRRTPRR